MLPAQPNRSLIDGLACLQAIASDPTPVGSRDLARRLGLEPTRVNRLLKTLAHLGLTRQGAGRKYTVGPGIHVLSAQAMFASRLIRHAIGPLRELQKLGLTTAFGVLWGDRVSYLYHAAAGMSADEALGRVGLFPASQSGIGMALLANQTDPQIRALYRGEDEIAGYPGGIEALIEEVERIRRRGYAVVRQPLQSKSLSVSVGKGEQACAAIALSGPIEQRRIKTLVAALQQAAESITTRNIHPDQET